ncbi:MAG: SDR family oxidoreductase [Thermoplasmatota archaeon]
MARILIVGAAGTLGKHVAEQAGAAGHDVVRTSRRARGDGWSAMDLTKDLPELEADVVIHCGADPFGKGAAVEVGAMAKLRAAAPDARILYPSIVGVDRIPQFRYYRIKLAAEEALAAAGGDHAIVRFTQFHEFADRFAAMPVVVFPRHFRFQSLAASEAAAELVHLAETDDQGLIGDFGGPEVLHLRQMVRDRLATDGRRKLVVPLPLGGFSKALAAGLNLCPEAARGQRTWKEHLAGDEA